MRCICRHQVLTISVSINSWHIKKNVLECDCWHQVLTYLCNINENMIVGIKFCIGIKFCSIQYINNIVGIKFWPEYALIFNTVGTTINELYLSASSLGIFGWHQVSTCYEKYVRMWLLASSIDTFMTYEWKDDCWHQVWLRHQVLQYSIYQRYYRKQVLTLTSLSIVGIKYCQLLHIQEW